MAKKVEFQSKNMIFRAFSALSEQTMEKIEIPRWTKVFFYMLEHFPKSSDHGKFVDVKMFDQIGFPNTLLKGAACVPKEQSHQFLQLLGTSVLWCCEVLDSLGLLDAVSILHSGLTTATA